MMVLFDFFDHCIEIIYLKNELCFYLFYYLFIHQHEYEIKSTSTQQNIFKIQISHTTVKLKYFQYMNITTKYHWTNNNWINNTMKVQTLHLTSEKYQLQTQQINLYSLYKKHEEIKQNNWTNIKTNSRLWMFWIEWNQNYIWTFN